MRTTLRYLFLTAIRDRLFAAMVGGLFAVYLLGSFLGAHTLVEQRETQVSFVAFGARLMVVTGMCLFVSIHVRRAFENREILLLLSRPISRSRFVLAYWVGFAQIGLCLVAAAAVAVAVAGAPPLDGLLLWTLSLALETGLMIAVALFFALALEGIVSTVMLCLGFYVLARMIGVYTAIANSEFRDFRGAFSRALDEGIRLISVIVPRLDLFGQSSWLAYGPDAHTPVTLIVGQSLIFIALVVVAAMFDFQRRRL